jgi:hypothetical protein
VNLRPPRWSSPRTPSTAPKADRGIAFRLKILENWSRSVGTALASGSDPESLHSSPPASDGAISIAEINLSKSLRRHFHRVIASASARPDLLDGYFTYLIKDLYPIERKKFAPAHLRLGHNRPPSPSRFGETPCQPSSPNRRRSMTQSWMWLLICRRRASPDS